MYVSYLRVSTVTESVQEMSANSSVLWKFFIIRCTLREANLRKCTFFCDISNLFTVDT